MRIVCCMIVGEFVIASEQKNGGVCVMCSGCLFSMKMVIVVR